MRQTPGTAKTKKLQQQQTNKQTNNNNKDGVCRMCGAWRVERWEWLWKSYPFNTVYSRQT